MVLSCILVTKYECRGILSFLCVYWKSGRHMSEHFHLRILVVKAIFYIHSFDLARYWFSQHSYLKSCKNQPCVRRTSLTDGCRVHYLFEIAYTEKIITLLTTGFGNFTSHPLWLWKRRLSRLFFPGDCAPSSLFL
jgi:hypothetical protein